MLGYVKAYKAELKIKDYEIYRGIYCSLCRSLGRQYSPIAQLFLSYDFTLAVILKLALTDSPCAFTQKRCPYNPAKKCLCCHEKAAFDFCAHALIITVYYKILDNISDSRGIKRAAAILLYPVVWLMHKKASKSAPEAENAIRRAMQEQAEVETNENVGIDCAAHPSADALGKIFSADCVDGQREAIYRFGYLVGRYIYILDATDDLKDDIKSGSFNPFKSEFNNIEDKEVKAEFVDRSRKMLNLTQAQLLSAFDELDIKRFGNIIENIALEGLDSSAASVFEKYEGNARKDKNVIVK